MIALVTGATGFIGGSLAASLAATGWEVRVLIRPSGRARLQGEERYRVFEADLAGPAALPREAFTGCEVVFHAAAIRDRWGTSPEEYRRTNVEGTRRLLAAAAGRARRFVYLSSVGVLGWPGVDGIDESFPAAVRPGEVDYHGTKAAAERIVRDWRGGPETVVVRPTITYGPGDRDGMLTRLIGLIARDRFVRIGRGENHFHLTFIDDLVAGLILAGTHPSARGESLILAGPRSIAVRKIIAQIERALGRTPSPLYLPESVAWPMAWTVEALYRAAGGLGLVRPGSGPPVTATKLHVLCAHRSFSSARAEQLLGYSPRVDYSEGLESTLAWMRQVGLLLSPHHPSPNSHPAARGDDEKPNSQANRVLKDGAQTQEVVCLRDGV
jgi:nucleoside-diphosphate-sugar epimerase